MNLDLSSLELPIRLRTGAPINDLEFERFNRENRPYRMEQEPNGDILIMTPSGYGAGSINRRISQARWVSGQTQMAVATCSTPAPASG